MESEKREKCGPLKNYNTYTIFLLQPNPFVIKIQTVEEMRIIR
jgi:hypothetical protein